MGVRADYEDIVMLSVIGEVAPPRLEGNGYTIGHDGTPRVLTTSGGITYNVRVGDRASAWAADHTEPGVTVRNAPPLEIEDGTVGVPVAGIVPPELMGAGIGTAAERSDYDIQTADREALAAHGLSGLRLGDLFAVRDYDDFFSHGYRKGAWTVACVAHADSVVAGHGPGVNTVLASASGALRPRLAPDEANIAGLLGLRPARAACRPETDAPRPTTGAPAAGAAGARGKVVQTVSSRGRPYRAAIIGLGRMGSTFDEERAASSRLGAAPRPRGLLPGRGGGRAGGGCRPLPLAAGGLRPQVGRRSGARLRRLPGDAGAGAPGRGQRLHLRSPPGGDHRRRRADRRRGRRRRRERRQGGLGGEADGDLPGRGGRDG